MDIITRIAYLTQIRPFIEHKIIKVLVGQRRTGKSYFLLSLQDEIKKKNSNANIIYINKELYSFDFIDSAKELYNYIESNLSNNFNYIFIDEIQEIPDFEKVLRDLLNRENIDVYITGSNAALFSGELATRLTGRYIQIKINPLSYLEFLQFHNISNDDTSLNLYMRFGGMPFLKNLKMEEEIVTPYLRSIFDTVLLKDIVTRANIRNVEFLIMLVKYIAENTGNIVSAKKISDFMKNQRVNIPPNTIINYLGLLTNTFLIDKVSRRQVAGKKIFEINDKYFFEDLGLRNSLIGFRPQDISKIIENVVYMHLIYLGYEVNVGVDAGREIDFVAQKNEKLVYVQVCYLLADEKAVEREFGNLLSIKDNYEKYLISMDKFKYSNYKGIKHLTLSEFLMNFE
ncbi:MAG: ATP-binding protein [Bacteroidetes bacterium]|nr:ATP-binding protein [Bacteroidota bacterium]MBU2585535.1 ATP-binding protein [Bacteroidota bacterium]